MSLQVAKNRDIFIVCYEIRDLIINLEQFVKKAEHLPYLIIGTYTIGERVGKPDGGRVNSWVHVGMPVHILIFVFKYYYTRHG